MTTQPRKGFVQVPHRRPGELREPIVAVEEPTLEQLENVARLMGLPVLPPGLQPAHYRESLLNLHKLVVRMLNGDEQAERVLEALQAAFGDATRDRA